MKRYGGELIVGERRVRVGRVVRWWGLVNGRGREKKGEGLMMEGLRIREKKDLERIKR